MIIIKSGNCEKEFWKIYRGSENLLRVADFWNLERTIGGFKWLKRRGTLLNVKWDLSVGQWL